MEITAGCVKLGWIFDLGADDDTADLPGDVAIKGGQATSYMLPPQGARMDSTLDVSVYLLLCFIVLNIDIYIYGSASEMEWMRCGWFEYRQSHAGCRSFM